MSSVKLFRKKQGGLVLGLCSGLAESLSVNVWMMRVGFIALSVFGGIGLIAYAITSFALSLKESPKNNSRRFLGLCFAMSQKWNLDISIIRFIMTYLIIMSGILPGLIVYLVVSIVIRPFLK